MSREYIDGNAYILAEVLEFQGIQQPTVAPAARARVYYNLANVELRLSRNQGAYEVIDSTPVEVDTLTTEAGDVLTTEDGQELTEE